MTAVPPSSPTRDGYVRIVVDEPLELSAYAVWPAIAKVRAAMVGRELEVALAPGPAPSLTGPCRVLDVELLSPRLLRVGIEVAADLAARAEPFWALTREADGTPT